MNTLKQKLCQLKLATTAQELEDLFQQASSRNLSAAELLDLLCDRELAGRLRHTIERRFRSSRLGSQPTIDQFNFNHDKSRQKAKNALLRLLDLEFIGQGANLVLIGNPGTGKTFLAKIFGWRACQARHQVLFTTAMDILNQLLPAQVDHSLVRKLKTYTEPDIWIADELGYLSLDQQSSNFLFQVISTRYSQKRSTIRTTNTAFSDWGKILYNTTHCHGDRRPARRKFSWFPACRPQRPPHVEKGPSSRPLLIQATSGAAP